MDHLPSVEIIRYACLRVKLLAQKRLPSKGLEVPVTAFRETIGAFLHRYVSYTMKKRRINSRDMRKNVIKRRQFSTLLTDEISNEFLHCLILVEVGSTRERPNTVRPLDVQPHIAFVSVAFLVPTGSATTTSRPSICRHRHSEA